jgi:RNA polymerase sigma-70 factor (ECF subfamily)
MSPTPDGARTAESANLSSVDLLARAQAGDREALEILFARYLPALKRWTSGRLPRWARDISDTTDLVQDTLLQTFKRIELFRPECEGALQGYLRAAVLNRIRDEFRRRHRRPLAVDVAPDSPASDPSPFELAAAAQTRETYEAALQRLRPLDRDLIVSRLEVGMTYEEIATAIGQTNANATRSAVVRAVVRLSEEMRAIRGERRE